MAVKQHQHTFFSKPCVSFSGVGVTLLTYPYGNIMYQGLAAETGMLSNPAELTGNGMWYIEM
jgi:hypothetical protein